MPKLPKITGKELLKFLEKNGFIVLRIRGSHFFVIHEKKNTRTTIPIHGKEILRPGILLGILSDIRISKEYFCDKFKK